MKQQLCNLIHIIYKYAAKLIITNAQKDWGIKDSYLATNEEMSVLINAGATIVFLNKNEGDGTFSHKIIYEGLTFLQSTEGEYSFYRGS